MNKQKHQNLNFLIQSISKDLYGVIDVTILLNKKSYTYPIISEWALRKVESLLRRHKPGKALQILKSFSVDKESNLYYL